MYVAGLMNKITIVPLYNSHHIFSCFRWSCLKLTMLSYLTNVGTWPFASTPKRERSTWERQRVSVTGTTVSWRTWMRARAGSTKGHQQYLLTGVRTRILPAWKTGWKVGNWTAMLEFQTPLQRSTRSGRSPASHWTNWAGCTKMRKRRVETWWKWEWIEERMMIRQGKRKKSTGCHVSIFFSHRTVNI